jgi:hypothetical protein
MAHGAFGHLLVPTVLVPATPTLSITYYPPDSGWQVPGSTHTVSAVAWSTGDIVVCVAGSENDSPTFGNPSNANLTFGAPKANTAGASGVESRAYIWASSAAASSQTGQTITVNDDFAAANKGIAALVVSGNPTGVANAIANLTESLISRTVSAGSVCVHFLFDWNGTTPPAKTPATASGTAVERADEGTSAYAIWGATWTGTSAGTFNFGPSDYTSLKVAQVFIEVTAPSGAAATPSIVTAAVEVPSPQAATPPNLVVFNPLRSALRLG